MGIYGSLVYLASLPGGWVADRLLGLRRAIWWGAVLITAGHFSIALSGMAGAGTAGKVCFFLGLLLIVCGTGLLKPNISAIVGDLYPEGGARRDAGFSIFYMGINLGAFAGQLITGYLGEAGGLALRLRRRGRRHAHRPAGLHHAGPAARWATSGWSPRATRTRWCRHGRSGRSRRCWR